MKSDISNSMYYIDKNSRLGIPKYLTLFQKSIEKIFPLISRHKTHATVTSTTTPSSPSQQNNKSIVRYACKYRNRSVIGLLLAN